MYWKVKHSIQHYYFLKVCLSVFRNTVMKVSLSKSLKWPFISFILYYLQVQFFYMIKCTKIWNALEVHIKFN